MSQLRCLLTEAAGIYRAAGWSLSCWPAGYTVRCMARDANKLGGRPWYGQVEVAVADATDPAAVAAVPCGRRRRGVLPHPFTRQRAGSFRSSATVPPRGSSPRLPRGPPACNASSTWAVSRRATLSGFCRRTCTPRRSRGHSAGQWSANGCTAGRRDHRQRKWASFEMLRYLTERLPVMVTPKWVKTHIQPIAVRDVLHYLVGCATLPSGVGRKFDIGGPDVLTYAEINSAATADVAGLHPRVLIPVPLLTPRLSSLWVGLVTPVPPAIARPLVESLRNEVVCADRDIARYVADPEDGLLPVDGAIALALRHTQAGDVSTRWSSAGAGSGRPAMRCRLKPDWAGGSLYVDERTGTVRSSQAALWRVIEGIGGAPGWYSFPAAWAVRGLVDRLTGGVGVRRGRREPGPSCRRRCAGLLAGGGDSARVAAAAARGDEATRPGLACA